MELYDKVILIEEFDNYKAGSKGIIVELYDNLAYVEIIDLDGNTLGVIYDVPLSILKLHTKWKKYIKCINTLKSGFL